jgi:1-acyl-sn-glycerol-3-phosphate acyltransferase
LTAARDRDAGMEELLSDLGERIDAQIALRRRLFEERARARRPAGGGSARIRETQSRLNTAIASIGDRIEAIDRERRARRSPGKRPAFRLSEIRRLVGQARRLTRTESVDDFGLDVDFHDTLRPFLEFLYERYFRVDAEGADRAIPTEGPAILVANRGGPFCYEAIMTAEAARRARPERRVRFLLDDVLSAAPGIGPLLMRMGGVRAAKENARRLLEGGEVVLFLHEPARAGDEAAPVPAYARLAVRFGLPLVPVAILGAEEAQPVIGRAPALARLLRMPDFPITLTGPLPLPVKFRIRFGEPIAPARPRGRKAAEAAAAALHDRTRARLVAMHHALRAARKSILLG